MDKRQKLIEIIKSAKLPQQAEMLLLAEVEKQQEITDEFIVDVADILNRIGIYLQTAGEVQLDALDEMIAAAQKANGAFEVLQSLEEQLRPARDSLQMFTGSAKSSAA